MRKILAFAVVMFSTAMLPAQSGPAQSDPAQFDQKISGDREIVHVLNRMTFGPRPGDVGAVEKMGLEKWIDLQLHPERIPEDEALAKLVEPLVENATPLQFSNAQIPFVIVSRQDLMQPTPQVQLSRFITAEQAAVLRDGSDQQAMDVLETLPKETAVQVLVAMPAVRMRLLLLLDADVQRRVEDATPRPEQPGEGFAQGKLYRAIRSERQLEEVLVDFWYNHFNVDASKGVVRALLVPYERDAIRPHVLGKFRDLLAATAHSPAMLAYLDNSQSAAGHLNENYGRELMELHTLGVDGGYTQKDVVEVARCFTGWTIDIASMGALMYYRDSMHDKGEKVVLGVTIPAGGGREDGEKVLDILARHPSTSRFISRELAQRFVADDPPPALVERMAKTFRDTDGDIRAVLGTLFSSTEFLSEGAYRSKLKTPLEMVVSAVRATGAQVNNPTPLVREIATIGQPLYRKGEPTGYSNVNASWASAATLVERMNFGLLLAQNGIADVKVDPEKFSTSPAAVARQVLFADADQVTLEAIGDEAGADGALMVGMMLGSPDFQRR